MKLDRLDHLVLTVRNVETTCTFYSSVLGMEVVTFENGRKALSFGSQKINLHEAGKEVEPKANRPTPGSADLCFVTSTPIQDVVKRLELSKTRILEGPVKRTGALGRMMSVYFRDPDLNLLEVSNYEDANKNRIASKKPS
ncbi:MAG TPA: VOC family protein [Candidatus Bathyarchaeia archaeon]|nr:VOC family protein [Candidatus Bathyarchaeia archaeon]